eukprot:scaffold4318_cov300-Prasinococcus_capsulatus_cf.AAC.1
MMVMEVDSHLGGLVFPVQDLVEGPGVKLAEDSEPGRAGPHQWEVGLPAVPLEELVVDWRKSSMEAALEDREAG